MDLNWFIYYQANVRWWSRLFLLYFKIIIINLVLGYCFDLEFVTNYSSFFNSFVV